MKKMLAGLLVVLTLVCAMPLGAFAAEPEDEGVQPLFVPECPKCGGVLNIERTWTEYTYYYTTIWVYVVCENGDYSSNEVMSQIPNQTTRKKNDNENESVTQID